MFEKTPTLIAPCSPFVVSPGLIKRLTMSLEPIFIYKYQCVNYTGSPPLLLHWGSARTGTSVDRSRARENKWTRVIEPTKRRRLKSLSVSSFGFIYTIHFNNNNDLFDGRSVVSSWDACGCWRRVSVGASGSPRTSQALIWDDTGLLFPVLAKVDLAELNADAFNCFHFLPLLSIAAESKSSSP